MNRRAFLRGSTALGLAALAPGRGLPAKITGEIGSIESITYIQQGPVAGMAEVARQALEAAWRALGAIERFNAAHDLTIWGDPVNPSGTMIRFSRPVEFHLVEPYEISPKQLALMELEHNMRGQGL